MKSLPGFRAKSSDVIEGVARYQFREEASPYMPLFMTEKDDIGTENAYFGDVNTE